MTLQRLSCLVFAIGSVSCASVVDPAERNRIRSVTVEGLAIGPAKLRKTGTTVFSNSAEEIPSWQVPTFRSVLERELRQRGYRIGGAANLGSHTLIAREATPYQTLEGQGYALGFRTFMGMHGKMTAFASFFYEFRSPEGKLVGQTSAIWGQEVLDLRKDVARWGELSPSEQALARAALDTAATDAVGEALDRLGL